MTHYEILLSKAEELGIRVQEIDFGCNEECGYYSNNKILINSRMNECQKYAVLAEELGHHHKTVGDIFNQKITENRKQELLARRWGYDKLIGIVGIINAHKEGCRNKYEIAEYFNVPENFINETFEYYKLKYPDGYAIDNYWINFNNGLEILENF